MISKYRFKCMKNMGMEMILPGWAQPYEEKMHLR